MGKSITIKVWVIFVSMLCIFLFSLFVIWFYTHPTDRVIQTWKQSDNVSYDKMEPFYLSVVEDDISIGRLPYSTSRRYYIYVGKDSGKPTYGHIVDYSFHPDTENIYNVSEYIKKCKVIWSKEGVTFEEPSGHKLFIPKVFLSER